MAVEARPSPYALYTEADDLKRQVWGWSARTFLMFALHPETDEITLVDAYPDKGEVHIRVLGPILEDGERADFTYAICKDDETLKECQGELLKLRNELIRIYRSRPQNYKDKVRAAGRILGVAVVF